MAAQGELVPAKANEPQAGQTARQEFAGSELMVHGETASAAVAAQAQAQTNARYIVAMRNPRDWDDVRSRLLKDCKRPGFAASARYRKPIGKGVEGPSIRFAEAAIRAMTNVLTECTTVYDDAEKRIVRVSVTDLESNVTYPKDVTIQKTVERRRLQDGQTPLSQRRNSKGELVYIVPATDDDILNKENALISKAMRTSGLRLLPGDILDECMDAVQKTLQDRAAQDPDAERKKVADAFSTLGVKPSDLKKYLGGLAIEQASPAQLVELRALFGALKDGEATWSEVLDSIGADSSDEKAQARATALREKIAARKK